MGVNINWEGGGSVKGGMGVPTLAKVTSKVFKCEVSLSLDNKKDSEQVIKFRLSNLYRK